MLKLLRSYPQLLIFGMLTAMFSGPGQTFLVSVFIPPMRESFGMGQAKIASIYSLATLVSAFLLPWVGRIYDRTKLARFTLVAGLLLALGCTVLSQSQGMVTMFIGFLLIRNLGQGTLTMVSSATMAKAFGMMRGKALALSNLGYPLSEALFPFMLTTWMISHDWRSGWLLLATLTVIFFLPIAFLLVRQNPHEDVSLETSQGVKTKIDSTKKQDWTVPEMLQDKRFYMLLLPVLIPPAYLTALFFHQGGMIVAWKGWSLHLISIGFIAYALFRIVISFFIGPAIDQWSAKKLFPYTLFPLMLGLFALFGTEHPFWCFAYLTGAGVCMGFVITVTSALMAECYGTKNLGSIKSVFTSLVVFSTALSPPIMGSLLDREVPHHQIVIGMILILVVGQVVAWLSVRD